MEVYSRRENLCFLGISESASTEENKKEVVYNFLERELELENTRDIEFQRVPRIGKKIPGTSRLIIACFLNFMSDNRFSREP